MTEAPRPANETERLQALASLGIDPVQPDRLSQDVARIAATLTDCPMAFVSILDADTQWFRGCFGVDADKAARDDTICSHTILSDRPLIIEDTLADDRFANNPFVMGEAGIRFYVGVPVSDGSSQIIGSLCVADTSSRSISDQQIESLKALARMLSSQHAARRRHHGVLSASLDAIITINSDGIVTEFNRAACELFGYEQQQALGRPLPALIIPPSLRAAHEAGMKRFFETGEGPVLGKRIEIQAMKADGTEFPVELAISPVQLAEGVQFTAFLRDLSGQKEREAQLIATRFTVDQAKDAVLWVAPDSRFIYANHAACDGLGYSLEELHSMTVFDIEATLPQEAWPLHWAELQQKRSLLIESLHRRKDGSVFPVEVSCNYIEIDNESFNCVIARDISERKAAEHELAQSEERFRDIADAAGEYIWEMDDKFRFVLATDPLLMQLGRTRDEVIGRTLFEFMPPDQAARLKHVFLKSARTGIPFRNVEHRCLRPDGSERWQRLSGKALPEPGADSTAHIRHTDNPIRGYRGMGLDVTEFKAAGEQRTREEALQAAARSVLSILLDPNAFKDAIARLLSEVGSFLGATRAYYASATNNRLECSLAWTDHDSHTKTNWTALEQVHVTSLDVDLEARVLVDTAIPEAVRSVFGSQHSMCLLVGSGNHIYAIVGFEGDAPIAPRSAREIDLLANVADGIALAVERADRKAQQQETAEQLEHALARANEANDSKTAFLANMSHELRTPLTAVLGFARMLEDVGLSDGERRSLITKIRSNGNSLLGIINAILDLSKIESGNVAIRDDTTDVEDMLRDAVSAVVQEAQTKRLLLRTTIEPGVPLRVQTDRMKVCQILMNFLGNAIRYTEQGEVTLSVSFSNDPCSLCFAVSDTGPGIAQIDLDNIFEAFDRGSTTVSGGTGLGLAIAKNLADALHARLDVDSTPGEGTCFTVQVPIHEPSQETIQERELILDRGRIAEHSSPGGSRLDGINVLLVEDSDHVREVVTYFLEDRGATLEIRENGAEAVEFIRSSSAQVDVILMDMQMPVLDGYDATRQLRSMNCRIPIIALTAHGMKHERDRCLAAGCDDYASKPVDPDALSQMIRLWVRRAIAIEPANEASTTLADLEARFRVHLAKEARELAAPVTTDSLNDVRRRVHKLAGAAGNLGFPSVTDAARTCENAIRDGAGIESVEQSRKRLVETIQQALQERP